MGPKGVLGAGLAILCSIMSIMLAWEFTQISRVVWGGIEREGVVVGQSLRVAGTSDTANAPIVLFTDMDGNEHRFEARMAIRRTMDPVRTSHETGETVTISYLPGDPQGAVIHGFMQHWVFLAGAFFAAFMAAIGFMIFRREQREMREAGW